MTVLFRRKICIKYTLTDCHRSLPFDWSIRWSMTFWPHWKNHFRLNNSCWIVPYNRICTWGKRRVFGVCISGRKKKRTEQKIKRDQNEMLGNRKHFKVKYFLMLILRESFFIFFVTLLENVGMVYTLGMGIYFTVNINVTFYKCKVYLEIYFLWLTFNLEYGPTHHSLPPPPS